MTQAISFLKAASKGKSVLVGAPDVFDFLTAVREAQTIRCALAFGHMSGWHEILNAGHLHHLNPNVTEQRINELIEQATADTADKSFAAIVNQRTMQAFKIRQDGGPQPNHGEIALNARHNYDADLPTMRRGKDVLKRLQSLLQQELGTNPRVFLPSEFLRTPLLAQIHAVIWPA